MTEPSIHDGWTPEPQEQVQPGDPARPSPDPVSEVRAEARAAEAIAFLRSVVASGERLNADDNAHLDAIVDALLTPAGPEERGEGLGEALTDAVREQQERFRSVGNTAAAMAMSSMYPLITRVLAATPTADIGHLGDRAPDVQATIDELARGALGNYLNLRDRGWAMNPMPNVDAVAEALDFDRPYEEQVATTPTSDLEDGS